MRKVSIADDIEISVKSSTSRKPKRVGSCNGARSIVGLERSLIDRSMNWGLAELNAAPAAGVPLQAAANTMPSSRPACASHRYR